MTDAVRANAGSAWTAIVDDALLDVFPDGMARRISPDFAASLSDDARAELGIAAITGPDAPPEGYRETGRTLEDVAGAPVWVATFEPVPSPPAPDEVPMYKVRKLLIKQGLLATVEAALAGMTGQAGELARVDWNYAPNLVRQSPLVQGLGAAIGLSSDEIDDLVRAATLIA